MVVCNLIYRSKSKVINKNQRWLPVTLKGRQISLVIIAINITNTITNTITIIIIIIIIIFNLIIITIIIITIIISIIIVPFAMTLVRSF